MSSSARFVASMLFVLLCAHISLHAQTSTKTTGKPPRGSVSGRVTIKDKPAPGVTVFLRQNTSGMPLEKFYKAVTDQEGFYRIVNVPTGTYDIATSAPAYVTSEANAPRGRNVVVGDDEDVEDINFSLVRGGVITGKIVDAEGRPVIQVQVNLYRISDFQQQQQQVRQVFPASIVQTDDRGIYRFFGLAAGHYKVGCGRGDEPYVGTSRPSRIIYKQVFHPDAMDQTKATVIDVREGSEAANVDITLGAPLQTFTVSGRVVDTEKGLPVPNVRFAFQQMTPGRFEINDASAISNARGDFVAEGFIPGKYGVVLFPNQDRDVRVETTTFEIVDQDVSGLTVRLAKGLSISGVVVLEHDDKKVFAKLLEFQLRSYVTAIEGAPAAGQSTWSTISPDGTFRVAGLTPGCVNLWLATRMMANPPKGFAVSRVEHNGVVLPSGIEIKEGDQLTGVRVFVSYGTAIVRGVVNVENGPLPDGARLFVRLMKPGTPPTPVGQARADARGHFLMESVPAGVYELSVLVAGPNIRQPATVKREVNVQDGGVNEVSLTLDLTPPPRP